MCTISDIRAQFTPGKKTWIVKLLGIIKDLSQTDTVCVLSLLHGAVVLVI